MLTKVIFQLILVVLACLLAFSIKNCYWVFLIFVTISLFNFSIFVLKLELKKIRNETDQKIIESSKIIAEQLKKSFECINVLSRDVKILNHKVEQQSRKSNEISSFIERQKIESSRLKREAEKKITQTNRYKINKTIKEKSEDENID